MSRTEPSEEAMETFDMESPHTRKHFGSLVFMCGVFLKKGPREVWLK